MKFGKRLGMALLLVVIAAGQATAQIPDPGKIALLVKIVEALHKANAFLKSVNEKVREFWDLQALMHPYTVLEPIRTLFRQVASIEEEIEQLACGWRFTPRVEALQLGLLKKRPLCKGVYQDLFGIPVPGIDADLAELRQWNSVRRLNTVATTFSASRAWNQAAGRYGAMTRAAGTSPGRAMRYLGALEALQLQQAVWENTQEAELLSAAQDELDYVLREDWRRRNYAAQLNEWVIASKDILARQSLAQSLTGGAR